ncbi:hypothetical protein E2542_SST01339 [Spatholobus suberectus]|nr:hypothetical protein E2542_SST01339 [Spatholobus suberectus]
MNQHFTMTAILERCKSKSLWGRFCYPWNFLTVSPLSTTSPLFGFVPSLVGLVPARDFSALVFLWLILSLWLLCAYIRAVSLLCLHQSLCSSLLALFDCCVLFQPEAVIKLIQVKLDMVFIILAVYYSTTHMAKYHFSHLLLFWLCIIAAFIFLPPFSLVLLKLLHFAELSLHLCHLLHPLY